MNGKKNKKISAVEQFKQRVQGRGGSATFKKYGREHFSKLSKLSWEKRRNEKHRSK